jgi:hypothetical protein
LENEQVIEAAAGAAEGIAIPQNSVPTDQTGIFSIVCSVAIISTLPDGI